MNILSVFLIIILVFTPVLDAQSLSGALKAQEQPNPALQAQAEQPAVTVNAQEAETPRSALSVSRLPDIKLNENIISKSVFSYNTPPQLAGAEKLFAEGQTQKAAEFYRNAPQDSPEYPLAMANLAVIDLQAGNYKEALSSINNAIKADNTSPLYQLIKIWALAAQGEIKKAQKEYSNMLFMTADFEYTAAAKLILTQALFLDKKYKEAINLAQNLYSTNPYVISHAIYLMGRVNFNIGAYKIAQTLFEQALSHDGNNYMAQKYLAKSEAKLKRYIPAWQIYASIFVLDIKDKDISKQLKKLSKHLIAAPSDYLYYTRLSEIYTKKTQQGKSLPVRIGLYAQADGRLTPLKSFTFLPACGFSIIDDKLGEVTTGEAYTPKTIMWNEEHKGIHIQNKWGNVEFSTKRPFIIKLNKPAAMQIKDPQADNIFAANLGDKELSGTVLVLPAQDGMVLINNTELANIMPALLTSIARDIKQPAVLEAMAIAIRTRMMKEILNTQNAIYDMPDYSKNASFGGINMQSAFIKKAVDETGNKVLTQPKGIIKDEQAQAVFELASPEVYRACGPVTEDGVKNTNIAYDYKFSPLNLFKYMLSNPPKDLLSAPQDPTLWSSIKWIYSVPVKEIQARLDNYYPIGKLKSIAVTAYSPSGRVQRMLFTGSKKAQELSFEQANFILAAGTLRSDFFFFLPLGKGSKTEYMFIGADTGGGRGLCINAADGMSRQGKTLQDILSYYYPDFKVADEWTEQKLHL